MNAWLIECLKAKSEGKVEGRPQKSFVFRPGGESQVFCSLRQAGVCLHAHLPCYKVIGRKAL